MRTTVESSSIALHQEIYVREALFMEFGDLELRHPITEHKNYIEFA